MASATAQSDIITVMQTPLKSLTSIASANIVYINKAYNPTQGTSFAQALMLFGEPFQASLGTFGKQRYEGVFQINVYTPIDDGRTTLNTILSELRGLYKRGTTLTNDNISVECKSTWEGNPLEGEGWYMVPVSVRWYAYTDN